MDGSLRIIAFHFYGLNNLVADTLLHAAELKLSFLFRIKRFRPLVIAAIRDHGDVLALRQMVIGLQHLTALLRGLLLRAGRCFHDSI